MTDSSGSLLGQGLMPSAQADTQRQFSTRTTGGSDAGGMRFSFRGQELTQEEASMLFSPYLQSLLQDGKWVPQAADIAATGTLVPATAATPGTAPIIASLAFNKGSSDSATLPVTQTAVVPTEDAESDPSLRLAVSDFAASGERQLQGETRFPSRVLSEAVESGLNQRESTRQVPVEVKTISVSDTGQGLALTQSMVTGTTTGSGGQQQTTVYIGPAVQHADWGNAFASRVAWQVGEGVQQARIQINPPELGPVEIRVSVEKDSATVQFVASQGMTREAIEEAIPRLRELLQQNGLQLGDTSVSSGDTGDTGATDQGQYSDSGEESGPRAGQSVEVAEEPDSRPVVVEHQGLVNERV